MKYVAAIVVAFLLVGCGGDDLPAGPNEESLRAYLAQTDDALRDKDARRILQLSSPETQEQCSVQEMQGLLLLAAAFGGEDLFEARTEITNVVIDRNRATYRASRVLDDGVVFSDPEDMVAIWDGKRWYIEDDSSCNE